MKRAAIYCRISRDAEQDGLGVARQEEDCRAIVEREGWSLVEPPFVDNDISASSLSKKPRPQYEAMLDAVRAGQVDVIVAYSNSRLTRRPAQWIELIVLANQGKMQIQTVASGSHDLTTADGRAVAITVAAWDAAEAERTGERLQRKFLEKAQAGSVNQGTRPFGWAEDKRRLHPKEGRLLRAAVEDVIDGVPLREVARRWNAAGVTTTRGKEWNHTAVRQVLRNPRLAGWRTHQGGHARDAGGERVRGVWTPMVDQATFDALQAALDGRAPRTRRGAQKTLLSGVARCGECGARMHGYRTPAGHAYACKVEGSGHSVTIAGRQTDALVTAVVAGRLRTGDLTGATAAPAAWPGEARLAAIPGQVKELMTAFQGGVLSAAVVFPQVQALEAEQGRLEAERPAAAPRPVTASPDDFPDLDLDRRRAVVDTVVEAVVVARAPSRGTRFSDDRLQVVWRA
ncbi:Resolvase YneB [Nocardioides aquaticus]|uniref:Resolvase YneB n=1 Tax=Nocardioides aquaticus TaxID=160826 RepID=A0ABX8EEU8_9ACTN|nr:recombinase family protein [Nocardioides aquaticus]QVT79026.1 Resolvase YneB [Nocardioides aquaticus]